MKMLEGFLFALLLEESLFVLFDGPFSSPFVLLADVDLVFIDCYEGGDDLFFFCPWPVSECDALISMWKDFN